VSESKTSPERVASCLAEFAAHAEPGQYQVPYCHHFKGSRVGPHVVFCVITHGNECGSLPAAVRLQEDLLRAENKPTFPVTILLGNPDAALLGVRYVEEDLNRVMTFDRPPSSQERLRAAAIRPVLDDADFFFDLHQTQTSTREAFWTMPWDRDLGLWARAIGAASVGLTRARAGAFSTGRLCLDEYVRNRGKVGITVELGEKGFDDAQEERAYRAMREVVTIFERLEKGQTLAQAAADKAPIRWYETVQVVAARDHSDRLRPGLSNFTEVRAGELLSAPDCPEIRAKEDGCILFPKYPALGEPPPPELFRLGVPLADPEGRFG
jgi:succinylglutamate desuccinylase